MGIKELKFKDEDDYNGATGIEIVIQAVNNGYIVEIDGDKEVFLDKKTLLDYLKGVL